MKYTTRDLLWAAVAVALACGWCAHWCVSSALVDDLEIKVATRDSLLNDKEAQVRRAEVYINDMIKEKQRAGWARVVDRWVVDKALRFLHEGQVQPMGAYREDLRKRMGGWHAAGALDYPRTGQFFAMWSMEGTPNLTTLKKKAEQYFYRR